ncbi:MAG: ASPIC/UnbV domain-containing protein [Candidatus Rokuibacteriota bacterium]
MKTAGSGFQGQSEGTLHFGLGDAAEVEELTVRWPSGREERFANLPADHLVRIVEGEGHVRQGRLLGWRPRVSGASAAISQPVTGD